MACRPPKQLAFLGVLTILAMLLPIIYAAPASSARVDPTTVPSSKPAAPEVPLPLNFEFPENQNEIVIPLQRGRDSWYVEASVNGEAVGYMLIDTGSAISALDKDVAAKLKLETIGIRTINRIDTDVSTDIVQPDSIDIGPLHVNRPRVTVMDTSEGIGATGVRVAGLLGCDVFAQTPFTLDTREGKLILYRRETFTPRDEARQVQLRHESTPTVMVTLDGQTGWFGIDTGFSGGGLVFNSWYRQHWELLKRPSWKIGGDWADSGSYYYTYIPTVDFLGETKHDISISIQTKSAGHDWAAGLIGTNLLADLRLTIDLAHEFGWVEHYSPDSVETYLARLGDPVTVDLAGQSPLIRALWQRREDAAHVLIARHANVNHADDHGITPTMIAAARGFSDSLSELIEAKADLEARSKDDAFSALHFAAEHGRAATAEMLLQHGAAIDSKTTSGCTPLFMAAQMDRADIVKVLLDHGAKVDEALKTGETPLLAACAFGNADCAELLLHRGANPNVMGKLGTPLIYACHHCSADCVRLLLAAGATVEQRDKDGFTPLIMAAIQRDGARCVDLLLKAGADPSATARGPNTRAIDYATKDGSSASMELLRRAMKR